MAKTVEEKVEAYDKKIAQLMEEKKKAIKIDNEKKRKKRNQRMIRMGGIVEKVLGRDTDDTDLIKFENFLYMQERNGNFFSKAMNVTIDKAADAE